MYPLDNHDLFIQRNENCEFLKAIYRVCFIWKKGLRLEIYALS